MLDLRANKLEKRLRPFLRQLVGVVLDEINAEGKTAYQLKDVYFEFEREIPTNAQENAQIELAEAQKRQTEITTVLNLAGTNVKGLPKGFEEAAGRWAKESGCDMLKKPSEAWAEAWGGYFTGNKEVPDYIAEYIKTASSSGKIAINNLIAFDEDAIMSAKIKEFSDNLLNGKIRTVISSQKQSRHILGSKEFEAYSNRLSSRGDHPSYIREDITLKDLEGIIEGKLGSGIIEVKGDSSVQEFFDCDEVVGYWYDKESGEYKPTKRVQIKYSLGEGNIHVIPVKEK